MNLMLYCRVLEGDVCDDRVPRTGSISTDEARAMRVRPPETTPAAGSPPQRCGLLSKVPQCGERVPAFFSVDPLPSHLLLPPKNSLCGLVCARRPSLYDASRLLCLRARVLSGGVSTPRSSEGCPGRALRPAPGERRVRRSCLSSNQILFPRAHSHPKSPCQTFLSLLHSRHLTFSALASLLRLLDSGLDSTSPLDVDECAMPTSCFVSLTSLCM